jgi:hypothetical protein
MHPKELTEILETLKTRHPNLYRHLVGLIHDFLEIVKK